MSEDWEREKQKAWARKQKELDFYPPVLLKQKIEEELPEVYDRPRLEDYEGMLEEFLTWSKHGAMLSYFPPPKKSQNLTRNRRPGFFKKQLYLVRFVIEQQISSKKQRTKIRKRINWPKISEAWNTNHPNDPRSSAALKKTFYRAITENDIQQEFRKEMGVFTFEALWYCRLSQVLDDVSLIEQWAKLFNIREGFRLVMGKALDDQQQELELEVVKNPDSIVDRLDETLRKAMVALINNIDIDEANKMSKEELQFIAKLNMNKGSTK